MKKIPYDVRLPLSARGARFARIPVFALTLKIFRALVARRTLGKSLSPSRTSVLFKFFSRPKYCYYCTYKDSSAYKNLLTKKMSPYIDLIGLFDKGLTNNAQRFHVSRVALETTRIKRKKTKMKKTKTTRTNKATTTKTTKTTKPVLAQQNAKKPGKKFSRASAVNTLKLMVTNGLMTRDEMTKKLALLDSKQALTDGTRSKDVTTQKCFDASRKAVKAVRNVSKAPSTCAYVDDSGKMVIVYITTAREGSTKYKTLAKSDYANDVRLARIHHQKRNSVKNAK